MASLVASASLLGEKADWKERGVGGGSVIGGSTMVGSAAAAQRWQRHTFVSIVVVIAVIIAIFIAHAVTAFS